MADGKTKVIWYTNWSKNILKLSDEEAGKLIKHFSAYVLDLHPEPVDRLTELLFDPIEDTLIRNLAEWKKKQTTNRLNGQKGGRPRKTEENPIKPNGLIDNPEKGVKVMVMDMVKAKVMGSDTVSVIGKPKKEKEIFNFKNSLIELGFEKPLIEDWLKVRIKKKATNTVTALTRFVNQVQKSDTDINRILRLCVEKDWKSFEAVWLANVPEFKKGGGTNLGADHIDRLAALKNKYSK